MYLLNDYIKQLTNSIIPSSFTETWFTDYHLNHSVYDLWVKRNYGTLPLFVNDYQDTDDLVKACLFMNSYKYSKLYETTVLAYNPLWNVDGTTTETHDIAQKTKTSDDGSYTDTTNIGSRSGNSKSYIVPYDTTSEVEDGKVDTTSSSATDTFIGGAKHRTDTDSAYTDTITTVRSGNIGVTSSQQLLNEERNVALFNFIKIVLTDIVKEITIPVYEEPEVWTSYISDGEEIHF